MSKDYTFTSESVSEGHPDKMADQISDAILDAIIAHDPHARVACETLTKTGMVVLAGEITTSADVDYEGIVRQVVNAIGYDSSDIGFDGHSCAVLNALGKQSPDINQGVDRGDRELQGAGDQGLMFGYASNETDVLMPAPITYAHRLVRRQAEVRKNGELPWLRPDAKSQVTFRYRDGKPAAVDAIVLSTQHAPDIAQKELYDAVMDLIIKPVIPAEWFHHTTRVHINPTGKFVIGGPMGDCGLTGRKIIVDSYGGMARHGGGAFSGKDPSKVDRSAAYAAATSRRTSSPPASPSAARSRSPTRSASRSRPRSASTPSARARWTRTSSSSWCGSTSICAPGASSPCSICCGRSTARPRATATSAATTSGCPGRRPTRRPRCGRRRA